MKLTDNQLATIVFTTMLLTILLFQFTNQLQKPGEITYEVEYPQHVIYINIIILFLCFMSIIGLVKLLQRKGKKY